MAVDLQTERVEAESSLSSMSVLVSSSLVLARVEQIEKCVLVLVAASFLFKE